MSLDRFKAAQDAPDSGFAVALAELEAGRKSSHWIWYILPQLAVLGRSSTARFYGFTDLDEAREYLRDPMLRGRLLAVAKVIEAHLAKPVPAVELMGGTTDSVKLVSCMTLFCAVARTAGTRDASPQCAEIADTAETILTRMEVQGFARCATTLAETERPPA